MKNLNDFIYARLNEGLEVLFHFTNMENLLSIIKDDTYVFSEDDGLNPKGWPYYMSTTRQGFEGLGYPTQLFGDGIVRLALDERALHFNHKITPIDFNKAKGQAIKASWKGHEEGWEAIQSWIKQQPNVECEERVLSRKQSLGDFHKYVTEVRLPKKPINEADRRKVQEWCERYGVFCSIYK